MDRETIWLFRTGYITTTTGTTYTITENGWRALDQHMIDLEEEHAAKMRLSAKHRPTNLSLAPKKKTLKC